MRASESPMKHCLKSLDRRKIVLNLGRRETPETVMVADSYLNVVLRHLAFKALLQCENGRVYSILELQTVTVPVMYNCSMRVNMSKYTVFLNSFEQSYACVQTCCLS